MSDPLNVDFYDLGYRQAAPRLEAAAAESKSLKEALKQWAKAQHEVEKAFGKVSDIVTAQGGQNFHEMEAQFRDGHMDLIEKIAGYTPSQQEIK